MTNLSATTRNDKWIPWCFFVFFAVVVSVNAGFFMLASSSWTGMVTENPYERGLNYNEVLAAQRKQTALGWRHEMEFVRENKSLDGFFEFRLWNSEGLEIEGSKVVVRIERPDRYAQSFTIRLTETSPGRYTQDIKLPLPGVWYVRLAASVGETDYRIADKFVLEP